MSVFASGLVDEPWGLAFNSIGNLYAAIGEQGDEIDKFDSSGNRSTFASGLENTLSGLAFDSGDNLYVGCWRSGTIDKFDSSGNMSIFASGLNNPQFIAVQVPEPATMSLLAFGGLSLLRRRRA
jgi:WD40 repeat protein